MTKEREALIKQLREGQKYDFSTGDPTDMSSIMDDAADMLEALAQPEQEPLTEWLVCPKCSYKSPCSPIKARTLAEDAERITKQAREALAQPRTFDDYGNKIV
jgi:hypothetical protein